jgi:hypothetical protein
VDSFNGNPRLRLNARGHEGHPPIKISVQTQLEQLILVFGLPWLQPFRKIEEGVLETARLEELEAHHQPAQPSIAITEWMERFELIVTQRDAHEEME